MFAVEVRLFLKNKKMLLLSAAFVLLLLLGGLLVILRDIRDYRSSFNPFFALESLLKLSKISFVFFLAASFLYARENCKRRLSEILAASRFGRFGAGMYKVMALQLCNVLLTAAFLLVHICLTLNYGKNTKEYLLYGGSLLLLYFLLPNLFAGLLGLYVAGLKNPRMGYGLLILLCYLFAGGFGTFLGKISWRTTIFYRTADIFRIFTRYTNETSYYLYPAEANDWLRIFLWLLLLLLIAYLQYGTGRRLLCGKITMPASEAYSAIHDSSEKPDQVPQMFRAYSMNRNRPAIYRQNSQASSACSAIQRDKIDFQPSAPQKRRIFSGKTAYQKLTIIICIPLLTALAFFYAQPDGTPYMDMFCYHDAASADPSYYETFGSEVREEAPNFRITDYEIHLSAGRELSMDVIMKPDKTDLSEYAFTLYHGYRVQSVRDADGNSLPYRRDKDALRIQNDGDGLNTIQIQYKGSCLVYYSTAHGIFLPSFFPYYPQPGIRRVYDSEIHDFCMKSNLLHEANPDYVPQEEIKEIGTSHYRLWVDAGMPIYCSIPEGAGDSGTLSSPKASAGLGPESAGKSKTSSSFNVSADFGPENAGKPKTLSSSDVSAGLGPESAGCYFEGDGEGVTILASRFAKCYEDDGCRIIYSSLDYTEKEIKRLEAQNIRTLLNGKLPPVILFPPYLQYSNRYYDRNQLVEYGYVFENETDSGREAFAAINQSGIYD